LGFKVVSTAPLALRRTNEHAVWPRFQIANAPVR
jgi:hypothetical protein